MGVKQRLSRLVGGGTGASLDEHGVAGRNERLCASRDERDTVLVGLDLLRNADLHRQVAVKRECVGRRRSDTTKVIQCGGRYGEARSYRGPRVSSVCCSGAK